MKNNELTQKQTVQGTKKVIAQNSKQAERILQTAAEETVKVEAKPKKEAKVHAESNEALGERLFKEKADQDRILKEFTAAYKAKQGVTDPKFVMARATIYMNIASRRAAAKLADKK